MKQFPPFRLDTVNQCLWRRRDTGNEERIVLTPKAFAVLRHLVEHAGRLVTQGELLDAVWSGTHVEPAALNNQILSIRNALEDRPKSPLFIETQFGRGYRFIAPVHDGVDDANPAGDSPSTKLVGRQLALSELRNSLEKALKDRRQIVFVTGEPGIGKTSLVDEFERQVATEVPGIRILRGQCVEGYGGKEAYYPMLEALSQLCHGPDGELVVRTLASQAPTWLVQFPALMKRGDREMLQREILGATRERMLREIGEVLEALASACPLLLVFEDLHWVDPSTVDLVSALARRRGRSRLMMLGTYRPADVDSSSHPLNALTQDLLVHHLCHEIKLEPLTESEITEYLTGEASGTKTPGALAALLYRHSEGNPLFMVAALEHLSERGFVSRDSGGWQLRVSLEEIDLGVPENLRRMIEARIERLSPEEQRVLEVASLHSIGRSRFGVVTRAAAIDLQPEVFEDVCETLSRRHGIVRPATPARFPDGTVSACYEFVHALYQEVCYRRIIPSRKVKLHRRLGEQFEARLLEQVDESAPWLAGHFEQGEDWPRAIKYLQVAAATARRRYAHREAIAILQRAAQLVSRLPERNRVASELAILEQIAICHVALWEAGAAVEIYEQVVALADRHGLIDMEIRALLDMENPAGWISAQRLIERTDRALLLSERQENPFLRARIRATCFARRAIAGRWRPEDAENCRKAIEQIETEGDRRALAEHRLLYAQIQSKSSRYAEAHRNAVDSLAILLEEDDLAPDFADPHRMRPYRMQQWLVIRTLFLWGKWGQALEEIPAATALIEKNGNSAAGKAVQILRAWVHLGAMDFPGVLAICESMPASFRLPTTNRQRSILSGSAEAAMGRYDRALEHLRKVKDEMDSQQTADDWYFRMPLQAGLTELWLARADLAQAHKEAELFLEVSLATAERTYQGLAWEANARVAMAAQDWNRAEACIAKALSTIEGYEVPLAAWRVHGTAGELYARAGRDQPAEQHSELSRATILKLANSLLPAAPLRTTFLLAPPIRRVLAGTLIKR